MLADIAVTTGGTVITEELGLSLEKTELEQLGKADRVVATKDSTTIVGGGGEKGSITDRVNALKAQLEQASSKFDREKLEERIAKLSGGVAVIRVGAATETEMKYLKLKIEDAVNATKAAIEEGIVPGGGTSLARAAAEVEKAAEKKKLDREEQVGYDIVIAALVMPLRQIADNTGKMDGAVVVQRVKEAGGNAGYNAATGEMVDDMIKAGIIDPVKVERAGVQHAVSAAAILLTSEAAIADKPEKESGGMPDMSGMGGGMPGMGGMM
jgi:chaperonin GroEL